LNRRYFCALALAGCLLPGRLRAQPVPPPQQFGQSAPEITALLRDQSRRARRYRYVWTGINGGLALGCFALLPLSSHDRREDYAVSGIASLVGAVTTFVLPLNAEDDERQLGALSELAPAERHEQLQKLLSDSADDEHARVTWPWHALNLGTSVLTGGIIAFGFGHTESGIQTGIVGFALGEAQILTQPTGLVGARLAASSGLRWAPRVSFAERAMTVGVLGSF
jgi:hypothetical protein